LQGVAKIEIEKELPGSNTGQTEALPLHLSAIGKPTKMLLIFIPNYWNDLPLGNTKKRIQKRRANAKTVI
jgi:hypothetical protein